MQGRRPALTFVIIVDEDHLIALTIPVIAVDLAVAQRVDVQIAADELALTLSFQDQVVALVAQVDAAMLKVMIIHLRRLFDAVGRVLSAPAGMKTSQVLAGLVPHFVVDVVVEASLAGEVLVGDLNPCTLAERHGQVAVETRPIARSHDHRQRAVISSGRMPDAEEVADGHEHAGLAFAVPVHLEDELAQIEILDAVAGEPDMRNAARPIDL